MKLNSNFLHILPLTILVILLPRLTIAEDQMMSANLNKTEDEIMSTTATPTNTNASPNNLIETACKHSSHKEFCVSSLLSDPTSKDADMTGLSFIALRLAKDNAAKTTVEIKQLLNNNSNSDPFLEQCLTDCSDHYADAIDQIDDSLAALSVKAYHDIYTWIKAAIDDADSCEESFKEQPGHPLVLSHHNKALRQLCNNALVVVKNLN